MKNLLHNKNFITLIFAIPLLIISLGFVVLKVIALIKYIGG